MSPKLRFKADDGSEFPEWEEKKLGDVCDIVGGGTPDTEQPEYWGGDVNWFTPSEIGETKYVVKSSRQISKLGLLKSSAKLLPEGTILLTSRATLGEMAIAKQECCTNQGFQSLIVKHECLNEFIYYCQLIIKRYCEKHASGSTFLEISKKEIAGCKLGVPSPPEQKKIALFLSTIDDIITTTEAELTAWEERKRGVMQKIFNREVRFKADDGSEFPEWEEKKMTELFTRIVEKNRTDLSPLTIIQGKGTVRRDESDRRIAYDKKGLKNYKAVKKDDFIVHLRSFEGGLEIANQDGIVSPAYHVYRGNGNVCPQFYYSYFRSNNFIKGRLAICVTGVRDGKNIEMDTFDELLLPCPSHPEQKKIADCLSSLDDVINQIQAELSVWKEFKKGLLQQMFV